MLATLSDLQVGLDDFDQYVEMRRFHINPTLDRQPGFEGSHLLRDRAARTDGEATLALFNFWDSDESAEAWSVASEHDEVAKYVIPLVRSISTKRYDHEKESSTTHGELSLATVARISIQEVEADRVGEYLAYRRDVIHPSMAAAPGFVSAWVFRDPEVRTRFAIYFRWQDDDSAEGYFHDPFHLGEITDRVREFLEGSLSTNRYDIVPV